MKVIPINLHKEVLTVAHLWLLERRDGYKVGLTDHDQPIVVDEIIYHPGGFTPSAVRSTSDSSVDNLDAEGILDPENNFIKEVDMRNGLWDFAKITLYRVDYTSPEGGTEILRNGWIGEVTVKPGQYRAELRGLLQKLQQNTGILITNECRHNLGDARCGVDLAVYTVEGTVESSNSRHEFIDPDRMDPNGDYSGGKLTFTSGNNNGASVAVKYADQGEVLLEEEVVFQIVSGDSYKIEMGCNKDRDSDCKQKFNNCINHGGFADLPGRDRLFARPTRKP